MILTTEDLQKFQAEHLDFRMELVNGKIIVMSPSGYESDEVALRFGAKLFSYVDERRCKALFSILAIASRRSMQ